MPRVKIKMQEYEKLPDKRFPWMTPELKEIFEVMHTQIESLDDFIRLMGDLFTFNELHMASQRWQIAKMVWNEKPYGDIAEKLYCSPVTVNRIAGFVWYGEDGFRNLLTKLFGTKAERIAVEQDIRRDKRREKCSRPKYKGASGFANLT